MTAAATAFPDTMVCPLLSLVEKRRATSSIGRRALEEVGLTLNWCHAESFGQVLSRVGPLHTLSSPHRPSRRSHHSVQYGGISARKIACRRLKTYTSKGGCSKVIMALMVRFDFAKSHFSCIEVALLLDQTPPIAGTSKPVAGDQTDSSSRSFVRWT